MRMLAQQLQSAHQKAGRAVTALKPVTIAEGLLYRMKLVVPRQTFDRHYFPVIGLKGKRRA